MKHTLIAGAVILTVILAVWCWSYDRYTGTAESILQAQGSGDGAAMQNALSDLSGSLQHTLLGQFRWFRDRLQYADAAAAQLQGDDTAAAAGFASLMSDASESELAFRSHYNQASILIGRGQLEAARTQLEKALFYRPDDTQAKINLELLLRKIGQQGKGAGDLKDMLDMRDQLSDMWLREDSTMDGPSNSSKRVWR